MNNPTLNKTMAAIVKLGGIDTSYGNDCCPSAIWQLPNGDWMRMHLDYDLVDNREYDGYKQFVVYPCDEEGSIPSDDNSWDGSALLETDDYLTAIGFVARVIKL